VSAPGKLDAVWIGMKRAKICVFVVFVAIAGIVTGLTKAMIRSERDQGGGTSASLSGFNNSPLPPPSRPLREQLQYCHPRHRLHIFK
jgi:hypothetical protein